MRGYIGGGGGAGLFAPPPRPRRTGGPATSYYSAQDYGRGGRSKGFQSPEHQAAVMIILNRKGKIRLVRDPDYDGAAGQRKTWMVMKGRGKKARQIAELKAIYYKDEKKLGVGWFGGKAVLKNPVFEMKGKRRVKKGTKKVIITDIDIGSRHIAGVRRELLRIYPGLKEIVGTRISGMQSTKGQGRVRSKTKPKKLHVKLRKKYKNKDLNKYKHIKQKYLEYD